MTLEELIAMLAKYGVEGLFIAVILWINKNIFDLLREQAELIRQNTQAINDLKTVIAELKTLIEDKLREK